MGAIETMLFEYDPAKSTANKLKHGLDFEEAQALWADIFLFRASARFDNEARSFAIGRINDRHWTAIYVMRGDGIRLISVRRSRRKEVEAYEGGGI